MCSRIVVAIASIAFAAFLVGCGESKEAYTKRIAAFADSVVSEGEANINIARVRAVTWHNAIFEHHMTDPLTGETTSEFVSDFNQALAKFESHALVVAVKEARVKGKQKLDSVYTTLKEAPSGAEAMFAGVKELYAAYLKTDDLAWNPEGSLTSYREAVSECRDNLKSANDKLRLDLK